MKKLLFAVLLATAATSTAAMEDIPSALGIPPVAVAEIYKRCAVAIKVYGLRESEAECIKRAALAYPEEAAAGDSDYYEKWQCSSETSKDFTADERRKCYAGTLQQTGAEQRQFADHAVCKGLANADGMWNDAVWRCLLHYEEKDAK
jgi:hypothetical protein